MLQIKNQSDYLADAMRRACELAEKRRQEFLTPEHLLWGIASQEPFMQAVGDDSVCPLLWRYIDSYVEAVPEEMAYDGPDPSMQLHEVIDTAFGYMYSSGTDCVDVPHVVQGILSLKGSSYARDVLLLLCDGGKPGFVSSLIDAYDTAVPDGDEDEDVAEVPEETKAGHAPGGWRDCVTCLNEEVQRHNPLIGREAELERTIQVLCRKDKNNPLHVGEPGVGKTALAYGLAARIEAGEVPRRLQGSKVYALDLGALMAGTQYRGDFEKRLKGVLRGVQQVGKAILYVDEIHNLIGAGRIEGSSLDASNLLKPYMEKCALSFMGATTYEEYNRHFSKDKAFARRFEKIDITEPTIDQCRLILLGLKQKYEEFHQVTYTDEAIEYAVKGAARYITGRYLPDKAIDLMDEAGAWRELHREEGMEKQVVGKKLIAEVLARTCNVDTLAEKEDDLLQLEHLDERIKQRIFGQDKAVKAITEAVLMAAAGLNDDDKPMASLLFVGPTGVGKTEVARVLADELALPLVRFDMSEYAEKHTVARLIGSPAGYVGYEDGGLLTDAIRKTPHCVLLLDELEKAHPDIYNILLQVMDYAVLTDNKGRKADFRHVIIILTTNSGAQFARQASPGFVKTVSAGQAMMGSVKKTFKPEFLNRLTDITIFNDMNRSMAERILDKKLKALADKLAAKNITMQLTGAARGWLLREGFSEEYGGREIDRVINGRLKPLLTRFMLRGKMKEGGKVVVEYAQGELVAH